MYLGGKKKVSKRLALEILRHASGSFVWEPFCGGLGLTPALADLGIPVVASDVRPELISLYQAVVDGWDPPDSLTEDQYQAAKSLPLTDPMYAFAAYPCSFGGKRWGGYARDKRPYISHGGGEMNFAAAGRKALLRDIFKITGSGGSFACCDWLAEDPRPLDGVIYCDPPYKSTTGYGDLFDHQRFYDRCFQWSQFCPVLVSEYDLPVGTLVWEKKSIKGLNQEVSHERLYKI